MIIVIDARLYGLENAGLGRYVINLIEELKNPSALLGTGLKNCQFVILLRKKYFNLLKFPANWTKVEADFRHYSIKEQIVLPNIFKKYKPDLIHFPHFNVPLLCNFPYVVTIHDMLMHEQKGADSTTLPLFKYLIKRIGYKLVFYLAIMRAKKIIVPSNVVKNDLIRYYSIRDNKIRVIYEGVDRNITRYSNSTVNILNNFNIAGKYIMYVGNAYPHKNIERTIKVFAKTKILFVVISSRTYFTNRLKDFVKKDRSRNVKIVDGVSDRELAALYKNSVGYIFPSLSEGFGLPGIEAMGVGTIVLASNITIFREIYQDNAIYFNPLDENSILSAINKVVNMAESERKNRVIKARDFIKKYSWSKMAKQTLDIYNSIQKDSHVGHGR